MIIPLIDARKLALDLLPLDDVVPARFMPPENDSMPLRLLLPCAAKAASSRGAGCSSSKRDDPAGDMPRRRLPLGRSTDGDCPPLSCEPSGPPFMLFGVDPRNYARGRGA